MNPFDLPVRYHRFFPGDAPLGFTQKTLTIDPASTTLLLVDVYHAAETPQGKELVNSGYDRLWWEIVNTNLAPLLSTARAIGLPIVYVNNSSPHIAINRSVFGRRLNESLGFDPTLDFKEREVNPIEFDQGEPVQLFFPPIIAPREGDYFIRKHTYSGFFETRLDSVLRNLGTKTLLCVGFVTDCCILFTLADAVFRGYNAILFRDCTLAAELPSEIDNLTQTNRTILWIESILAPTTTTPELFTAIGKFT